MIKSSHCIWVILALVLGSVLRLVWLEDMEWKTDEIWMYYHSTKGIVENGVPVVGMSSGVGIRNPGMSVWVFVLLGMVSSDPLGMARWVQVLNVASLWGYYFFIQKFISFERSGPWIWGLVLVSFSPLAILYSRKIWAQSVLFPFCLLFLLCHFKRNNRVFGLIGGFTGMLLGQIHMSGFFFFAGIGIWSIYEDIKLRKCKLKNYSFWIFGAVLGLLPMLPWIIHIVESPPISSRYSADLKSILVSNFYAHWFAEGFGLHLNYSFKKEFSTFLSGPRIFDFNSYLIGLAHVFLGAIGVYICLNWAIDRIKKPQNPGVIKLFPEARFYIYATAVCMGVIITLSGVKIYPHYQIVVFPFIYIWVAIMCWNQKWILKSIIALQLILSISVLVYVHTNGGIRKGDYGISYKRQNDLGILRLKPKKIEIPSPGTFIWK